MPRDAIVSLIAPSPLMENHGAKHFAKTPHSIILKDSLFLLQSLMKMLRKSIDWKRCSTVDGRNRKCNQKNVKVLPNVNFKDFIHALTFFSVFIVSYNGIWSA